MTNWRPALGIDGWVETIRPAAVEIDAVDVTPEACREFHRRGIRVQAKVLGGDDRPEVWDRMAAAGVDWLQTDRAEEILVRGPRRSGARGRGSGTIAGPRVRAREHPAGPGEIDPPRRGPRRVRHPHDPRRPARPAPRCDPEPHDRRQRARPRPDRGRNPPPRCRFLVRPAVPRHDGTHARRVPGRRRPASRAVRRCQGHHARSAR